jgi:hypothetical protein
MDSTQKLFKLLGSGLFAAGNLDRISRVFYDAAKIVYERQKQSTRPQLKMRDISSALILADSLHSRAYRFVAGGDLAGNFGGGFGEADALDYYDKRVTGTAHDKLGRTIRIDDDGMKSLYKDDATGLHVVASENYEEGRGKRLPWIRHTLQNSGAIYVSEETRKGVFHRAYLYTAIVSIPLREQKPKISYYVVVVREGRKNEDLKYVTAYYMLKLNDFLRVISPTHPLQVT